MSQTSSTPTPTSFSSPKDVISPSLQAPQKKTERKRGREQDSATALVDDAVASVSGDGSVADDTETASDLILTEEEEPSDPRLENLKSEFGTHNWAPFIKAFPNWEESLKLAGYDSIVAILLSEGFKGAVVASMGTALLEYFKRDTGGGQGVAQRTEGGWPTLLAVSDLTNYTTTSLKGQSELKFLKPAGGTQWVFCEPDKPLMLRPALYLEMWKKLEELRQRPRRYRGLLIEGHPGIGKTHALDVLLALSLEEDPTTPVVVVSVDAVTIFGLVGGKPKRLEYRVTDHRAQGAAVPDWLAAVDTSTKKLLLLHDIKTAESLHYQAALTMHLWKAYDTTVVVASSPKESNYKDFLKDCTVYKRQFLPTLSETECLDFMKECCRDLKTDKDRGDVFFKVGGVPRHFEVVEDAVREQERACPKVEYEPDVAGTDEMTSKLVRMVLLPNHPPVYDFVSDGARELWVAHHTQKSPQRIVELLSQLTRNIPDHTRDILGRVFEKYVEKRLLAQSTGLNYTELPANANATPTPWKIPSAMDDVHFHGNDVTAVVAGPKPSMWIPHNPNFPFVDFIIVEEANPNKSAQTDCTLVQVTVASSHRPKKTTVEPMLEQLARNGLKVKAVVWVVHSSTSFVDKQTLKDESGGKQSLKAYDEIQQYRCKVDP